MSSLAEAVHTELPVEFGFRNGDRGTMSSRTIMLAELSAVLGLEGLHTKADFFRAINEENVLGKKTASARRLTAKHLSELYALDDGVPVFRLLRLFWGAQREGRPLLALLCAAARDPLLRMTAGLILKAGQGEAVPTERIEGFVRARAGERFSDVTLSSIARNVSSSWRQSGHLTGVRVKTRSRPELSPASAAYALLLGYLCGARGPALFETFWASLLDAPEHLLREAARAAARRGWMNFRAAGEVVEVDFAPVLTRRETESLA